MSAVTQFAPQWVNRDGILGLFSAILARTVDYLFPSAHHSPMAPSRPSRFRGEEHAVTQSAHEDEVTVDERQRRRRADLALSLRAKAANITAELAAQGVRPDQEVRTDATREATIVVDGWQVRWVLASQAGGLVPRALHLEPVNRETPPGGITTNLLRELSPSDAVSAAAAHDPGDETIEGVILNWSESTRRRLGPADLPDTRRRPGPPGRPRIGNDELARAAAAYLDEVTHGPGVTRRVADRLGLLEDTTRDRIRMARARGFLTPTQRGRRGGQAGPALLAYMKARQEVEDE